MKQQSRGEDDEAGREKKREASTGVMVPRMCLVIFCLLNIYILFSGTVNQSFYQISISSSSIRYLIDRAFYLISVGYGKYRHGKVSLMPCLT